MIENLITIDIDKIVESKTNPRKTFDPLLEKDLVESIKTKGITTPLLVRQVKTLPGGDHFEIVDGARRFRAAKEAGLTSLPAIKKLLNDEQAFEVQLISFTQRADIHPLDEAAAYEQLRKKQFDIAQISAKVGKDRSYIAKRLQLITLIEPAKKQLRDGTISLSHAIEIARLQPDAQKEALDEIYYNAGTAAKLRDWIKDELMAELKDAPFKLDDATLVPKAGPCFNCLKRSSLNQDLFGDISREGDRCLDRKCYNSKLEAFGELNTAKKEEAGESGSHGKAPISMERRKELYKRRMEIFENRIEQEARLRTFESLLLRLKWPIERKDFDIILLQLTDESHYNSERLADTIGLKEDPDTGSDAKKDLKNLSKLTDQQAVQLAFGVVLDQELIEDPLMGDREDDRFVSLCSRHGVDRKKIRDEVATSMAAKKPKPPKIEPPTKKEAKKPVSKPKPKAKKKSKN